MKKSEIRIGEVYSNGKGQLRKVIDITKTSHKDYKHDVKYIVIGGFNIGREGLIFLPYFARWAKEEVKEKADDRA